LRPEKKNEKVQVGAEEEKVKKEEKKD